MMAVDQFARMMALDAAQQGYTKAETDELLDGKADLVNGVVPISQIPPAAIEREVPVADDAARFALTTADVQLGDTVRVVETGLMYLVVNTAHLDTEAGYQVYVAGRAAEAVADQYGNIIDTTYATKATTYTKTETDALIANKPGEITTGKQYTIDGQTVTAGTGAEAFNNLANNKAVGNNSHAEGIGTTASGENSHAEGGGTTASGIQSHSECAETTASGDHSHAEGNGTKASGNASHAEGVVTKASGAQSHAEGGGTTASGSSSHAEGGGTIAFGDYSHAEGIAAMASGARSHAEGNNTKASSADQHVQGKFNVEDANSTYAFIIGNGTADNARHNAFAIDWNGLIYVNGAATGVDVSQLTPVTVDQTYDPTSTNAQSGVAIAGIIGDINTVLEEVL